MLVLLQVVFRLLLDRGDTVLCEEFTYPHIAESLVGPQGFVAVPLALDGHGIVPRLFRRTLEAMRAAGKPLPRLLYTVPVGQNPTGPRPGPAITPMYCRCNAVVSASQPSCMHAMPFIAL
jgi:DNA-binding transcriptional MocR family regulator